MAEGAVGGGQEIDVAPVIGSREKAMKEGACLSNKHPDFLLYQAAASGGKALRQLMIPCLMESLGQLGPSDDFYQACLSANRKIQKELQTLDPDRVTGQLPKIESTLVKKFCIGK